MGIWLTGGAGISLPEEGNGDNNRNFLRTGRTTEEVHRERFVYIGRQEKQHFRPSASVFHVSGRAEHGFCHGHFFSFQQTYGNFTMPLFIALVVSYMFKDRIKDLMHYWFANKLGSKFYDYKIKLVMHGEPVGWGKEGCDFVNEEKLPLEGVRSVAVCRSWRPAIVPLQGDGYRVPPPYFHIG